MLRARHRAALAQTLREGARAVSGRGGACCRRSCRDALPRVDAGDFPRARRPSSSRRLVSTPQIRWDKVGADLNDQLRAPGGKAGSQSDSPTTPITPRPRSAMTVGPL